MITLGLILLLIGLLFNIGLLWTVGLILAIVGLILMMMGKSGRPVGSRNHYW